MSSGLYLSMSFVAVAMAVAVVAAAVTDAKLLGAPPLVGSSVHRFSRGRAKEKQWSMRSAKVQPTRVQKHRS